MSNSRSSLLEDSLAFLIGLRRDGSPPESARASFRSLQSRHPQIPMKLLWQEEHLTREVHYDVLLPEVESGTVSLGYCPERAVPWALRNVDNPGASCVLRVNQTYLTVEEVMNYLDFVWDEARIPERLVNACLIRLAIEEREIKVSDEELQRAMDDFRLKRKLYGAEETLRWIGENGTTVEKLERVLEREVARRKLRDQVTEARIADHFTRHSSDFDAARIARFRVMQAEQARSIGDRIRNGELNFFAAARQQFLANDEPACGVSFAAVRRKDISEAQAAAIFAASPEEVIGPVKSGDSYDMVQVIEISPARFDRSTIEAVKAVLFDDWLTEQRRKAEIDWHWGEVDRNSDN